MIVKVIQFYVKFSLKMPVDVRRFILKIKKIQHILAKESFWDVPIYDYKSFMFGKDKSSKTDVS